MKEILIGANLSLNDFQLEIHLLTDDFKQKYDTIYGVLNYKGEYIGDNIDYFINVKMKDFFKKFPEYAFTEADYNDMKYLFKKAKDLNIIK